MKKILPGALTLAMIAGSLPGTALAADNSVPVTKNGERLKYNTPYYFKDKTLPNKGGVTVEPYLFHDYILFSNSPTDNGDPIIFENPDGTDGFIQSGEALRIRATKVIEPERQYWRPDNPYVFLSRYNDCNQRLYGSSKDNSIGIGTLDAVPGVSSGINFYYYRGAHNDKAWLTRGGAASLDDSNDHHSPVRPDQVEKIETPFELIEVSE
ncbi:Kunitz family serine protease inhibitor [Bacillus sp. GMa5/2]